MFLRAYSVTCTTPPLPLVTATVDIRMTINGFASGMLAYFTVRVSLEVLHLGVKGLSYKLTNGHSA